MLSLSQVSQVSLPNSHVHDILCPCFQDNIPWMHCLLLQNLLVPSRYWPRIPGLLLGPVSPVLYPKQDLFAGGHSVSRQQSNIKKFNLLSLESYFIIKTASHTSNYLHAASCLDETVWEHFRTKKNFVACFRTRTQIQNLYQSSIQFCWENDFLCYICLWSKMTAQRTTKISQWNRILHYPNNLVFLCLGSQENYWTQAQSETKSKQTSSAKALFCWLLGGQLYFYR